MKTMVFDIERLLPTWRAASRILNLEGLPDAEVAKAMTFHRLQNWLGVPAAAPAPCRGDLSALRDASV